MASNKNSALAQGRFSWQLASNELRHNWVSSLLIIIVVAAICVPMLIVASLKEGYIDILINEFERSSQAKRIDIVVSSGSRTEQYITDSLLAVFQQQPGIAAVVPEKRRPVYAWGADGQEEAYDAITTTPDDPDLKRYGFTGTLNQQAIDDELSVIIHTAHIEQLGFDSLPDSLNLLVKRKRNTYVLPCKVLGSINGGSSRNIYIPVTLGKKLERWSLGFGVALGSKGTTLPSGANIEEALGWPVADSCLALTQNQLDAAQVQSIADLGYTLNEQSGPAYLDLWYYTIRPKDSSTRIDNSNRNTLEDALAGHFQAKVVPYVAPVSIELWGNPMMLHPSTTGDMRRNKVLTAGNWLNTYRNKFEIMVPESALPDTVQLPYTFSTTVGDQEIALTISGTVSTEQAYADYVTLFRMQQIMSGIASYDASQQRYSSTAKSPYEDRFLYARVHAKSLDDVLPVVEYFTKAGYEIFGSSAAKVESIQQTNRLLTNFMLLINIAGGLACIAALFVLMFEAIKRKRNQIGIMRAMGLSTQFIRSVLLNQSIFYGLCGLAGAFVLFQLLRLGLDNEVIYEVMGIAGLDGQIFSTSWLQLLAFVGGIALVSYLAGHIAASSVRNIDPANIMDGA